MFLIGNYIGIRVGRRGGGFSFQDAEAPTLLTATTFDDDRIDLGWTDNSTHEDGYRIYISTDNITFTVKGTVGENIVVYSATGLTENTLYYFYVVAYKGLVESIASNTASATTWSAGEVIIRAGNTPAWYDYTDLTTITKDGANLVSRWNDKLLSGHDLIQANGALQPLYSADGITFEGIDNVMLSAAFTYNQPIMIYLVIKNVAHINWATVFCGVNYARCRFFSTATSPATRVSSDGTKESSSLNMSIGTFHIVRILFNGVSGKFTIDTTSTTGDYGVQSMGQIRLGADNLGSYSNICVKEAIFRDVADLIADETAIYNYLATKYGFATI